MWVILEKAKKEEVEFSELKFIRDFRVHPSFSAVLSLERQLDDVVNFCTDLKEFSVFVLIRHLTYLMTISIQPLPLTEILN